MTTQEFDRLIDKVESAIDENEDQRTALIYLHKLLGLMEGAAFCAWYYSTSEDQHPVLSGIKSEAHERSAQVIGFIQEMVREEGEK